MSTIDTHSFYVTLMFLCAYVVNFTICRGITNATQRTIRELLRLINCPEHLSEVQVQCNLLRRFVLLLCPNLFQLLQDDLNEQGATLMLLKLRYNTSLVETAEGSL